MSVKLSEIISVIENFAPKEFKEDYDNVGLMVGDRDADISSILVSLDTTLEVIKEAAQNKCELIISHHPLLFRKAATVTEDTLLGKKIRMAIKNNINIYASHTNLDVKANGMNDLLIKLLGFDRGAVMEKSNNPKACSKDGIGRLVELQEPMSLEALCGKVKEALKLSFIRFTGEKNWQVNKVAVINGSGQDYFNLAARLGADCIISGDTTYHYVSDLYEEGIAVIDAGHYGTEWPAMMLFAENLKVLLKANSIDLPIVISGKNFDPYKAY
ncbi:Nif3-like dinuclear metal center hexameric protein [Clostridium thermarum]|uniref:Nif3-like dinuclear metal center hexameric protein n=1 Tax=Clostridium thermarum TaxID=1716543 RepID=UPI0013D811E2|nr:Nif3-like dinuclear metal center hexameric protein [Clostridium thermarum]